MKLTCSVRQAAELLGTSESFVRRAVAQGAIPALKVGRLVRIPTSPLLRTIGAPPADLAAADGPAQNEQMRTKAKLHDDLSDCRRT